VKANSGRRMPWERALWLFWVMMNCTGIVAVREMSGTGQEDVQLTDLAAYISARFLRNRAPRFLAVSKSSFAMRLSERRRRAFPPAPSSTGTRWDLAGY
jgi:hypothetical protein